MKILTQQQICKLLDTENIQYELFEHPPVHTVEDAQQHCKHIPGTHVKNLCLRNKKKTFYCLITIPDEKRIDLKELSDALGHGRLSFVNSELLIELLGVKPGSVNPFCLINDADKKFHFYMDTDLQQVDYINVHPMENNFTLHMQFEKLISFLKQKVKVNVRFLAL